MCPYAQRVWIVLEELGIPYEKTLIDLRNKPAWYLKEVNPLGKVPAVRDRADSMVVYESLTVGEYLVDRFDAAGESGLMPADAAGRARVRLWNAHLDSVLSPAVFTCFMNKDEAKEEGLRECLGAALQVYEDQLVGPFLCGEAFTLADAAALPFFERMLFSLRHFKDFDAVPADRYPRLSRWVADAMARPSFVTTRRPEDKLVEVYRMFYERDYAFGGLNRNK